jgi:FixJ family two-component response regulator
MNILQGIHNGASGFMVKPFTDERVIRTIQRLLVNIEKKLRRKKTLH